MKRKKERNGKKKVFQWLFWIFFAMLCAVFLYQIKWEREMVQYYNRGNRYYEDDEFELAQGEYQMALYAARKLVIHRQCDVRCNLALSIVAPLAPETVTEDNRDDVVTELLNARYILTAEECAHEFDNRGHDRDCQTLKNEIDGYLERLTPQEPEREPEPEESEPEQAQETDREMQVREELEKIQNESVTDRKSEMDAAERLRSFEFYDGACW